MVKISFPNIKPFIADLSRFNVVLDGEAVEKAAKGIKESFHNEEKRLFMHESGPSGKWSPLSERYAKRKRRKFRGKPKMRRTDKLYNSLTTDNNDSIIWYGNVKGKFRIKLGTNVDYAIYHQKGSKSTRLPVRRVIDPRDQVRYYWIKLIHTEIIKAARKNRQFNKVEIKPGHWDNQYNYIK